MATTNGTAPAPTATASSSTGGHSFARRDKLLSIEKSVQQLWQEGDVYTESAPPEPWSDQKNEEKFFVTFPYPYMNGRLHLGHAFSLTKAEFQARFQRTQGKRVLWPFGFHCTGMPIAACADKLKREIVEMAAEREGAKENDCEQTNGAAAAAAAAPAPETTTDGDLTKFKGKKSKAASKAGKAKGQWEIMVSMGVPESDIPEFAEAGHWLQYFPPLAVEDLKIFGMAVDWRRSFITTDANPYYDAFIRWQFNKLKAANKIKYGKRHSIFSRIEGQPCADHDRASGEGVGPQEYTLVKMKVLEIPAGWKGAVGERSVFLVAATLRPETMYGQTNCFVKPEGDDAIYGAYLMKSDEVFICSRRSALNMAYQDIAILDDPIPPDTLPEPRCLHTMHGKELIGLKLRAPLAVYDEVYALPMTTISMDKGTGVVTSVPSDAPDDYAALKDLQDKHNMRNHFGVKDEWCDPLRFKVVPIIDIPGYGDQAAVKLYHDKKIQSQKDKVKLAEAKEEVYKKGFYEGVMLVGNHAGKKVEEAKNLVRKELIDSGDAVPYFEPEKPVMSRSGDDCVVALCDQWYLDYGEDSWRTSVESHVSSPGTFNAFNALGHFRAVLSWLCQWACSRNYGLGSFLPWDDKVVIESLSDSTIYMAYYTIAHMLHGDTSNLDGSKPSPASVKADQLTDEVFDYIFLQTDTPPQNTSIPTDKLDLMRREFAYWYPMDLRCSGKDLINNHLTMALYNHAAIWDKRPDLWPKAFFTNGHVMVDNEKMSKSVGNFLTLKQSVEEFTADATRLALADAGDALEDANFQRKVAETALLRLWNFEQFVAETVKRRDDLRSGPKTFVDEMLINELKILVNDARKSYAGLVYREALRCSFYDMQAMRDAYKTLVGNEDMHREAIQLWMEWHVLALSPICPHICEHIWTNILTKPNLIVREPWPTFSPPDPIMHRKYATLKRSLEDFRKMREKAEKTNQKSKNTEPLNKAVIYVASEYLGWQQQVLQVLQTIPLDQNSKPPPPKEYMEILKNSPALQAFEKKLLKDALSFADFQMKEVHERGPDALDLNLPFDERELLLSFKDYISSSLKVEDIEVVDSGSTHPSDSSDKRLQAVPSRPVVHFYSGAGA